MIAGDIKPEHIVHRAPDHDGGTVLVVETADGWQWFRCDAADGIGVAR